MIRPAVAILIFFIAGFASSASAQERVTVGTMRLVANGALFLGAARGYFKAEGLDLVMRAYPKAQAVAQALAGGEVEYGLTAFTPAAFDLAGHGRIRAIAAQVREKRGYEGNVVLASTTAYARGLRKYGDLANHTAAITAIGSPFHYQLGLIAAHEHFDLGTVRLRPMQSVEAIRDALAAGQIDAAILPPRYARELLLAGQARLIGWLSDIAEPQRGALFASAKTLRSRDKVTKFLRAYRRSAADYVAALLRYDGYRKRITDKKSKDAGAAIGHYVYPGHVAAHAAAAVEREAYFMDAQARLDMADLERQIAWYKAQHLIGKAIEVRGIVDLSFVAGR
jgi:NitT/TauT family transport system substrate-binding protein